MAAPASEAAGGPIEAASSSSSSNDGADRLDSLDTDEDENFVLGLDAAENEAERTRAAACAYADNVYGPQELLARCTVKQSVRR